jgi:hypothetical protein
MSLCTAKLKIFDRRGVISIILCGKVDHLETRGEQVLPRCGECAVDNIFTAFLAPEHARSESCMAPVPGIDGEPASGYLLRATLSRR